MAHKLNGQKNIYDIINKEKLDVVNLPISEAHGLPNECYNNVEYTKIERKKLFEDKWVVIGVASSVPDPGDAKTFDLLEIPLIISLPLVATEKEVRYTLQAIDSTLSKGIFELVISFVKVKFSAKK